MSPTNDSYYKRLCRNIISGRFNWQKYLTPGQYFGREICTIPLFCSYGQIGYSVFFPFSDEPYIDYDWEFNRLDIVE